MSEKQSLAALDIADLENEFEVVDLAQHLEQEGFSPVELYGKQLIPEVSWKRFIHNLIQRDAMQPGSTQGDRVAIGVDADAGGPTTWGERRTQQLARHPQLERLIGSFKEFITEALPGTTTQQNKWTITFVLPDGRRAGMKPRVKGLWLYARRSGKTDGTWVKSPDDFEHGLSWLRALPQYSEQ